MAKALALLVILSTAACQTTGGSFCAVSDPIRFDDATVDAMTDDEVAKALAHNLKGAKLCGWKA